MKSVRYLSVAAVLFAFVCVSSYLVAAPYAIIPFLSPVLMLLIPLVLGVFLLVRLKADLRIYGLGIITFIASQLLLLSFNSWTFLPLLNNLGLSSNNPPGSLQLALFAISVGLSAGAITETARYVVYSRWLEKARTWKDGLMFGAGHGSLEAGIVGVVVLLTFLQALTVRNGDMSQLDPDQLEEALAFSDVYWNTPWYFYLLPLVERVSAIIFHLSASLLVMQAFTRRNLAWYLAAILLHTLLITVGIFAPLTWGITIYVSLLLAIALLSIWIISTLRTDQSPISTIESSDILEETPND